MGCFETKVLANEVRRQTHGLAYNLANFMRTPALPKAAEKTLFPRRWYGGMISANLEVEVIWEMSVERIPVARRPFPRRIFAEA